MAAAVSRAVRRGARSFSQSEARHKNAPGYSSAYSRKYVRTDPAPPWRLLSSAQFLPHLPELVLGKRANRAFLSFCRTGRRVPSSISKQSSSNRSTLSMLMVTPRLQLKKFSCAHSVSSTCAKLYTARHSPSSVMMRTKWFCAVAYSTLRSGSWMVCRAIRTSSSGSGRQSTRCSSPASRRNFSSW